VLKLLHKGDVIMEAIFLWIVTALYIGQGLVSGYQGHIGFAMVFAGYAFANIGLIWAMK
jgi:hypothetical protein